MKVSQLQQLLTRFPGDAEVFVSYSDALLPVEKASLDFATQTVEIDPGKTWHEQAGPMIRLVLSVGDELMGPQ